MGTILALASEHDFKNGRIFSMWSEDGINYRANILLHPGASVPLHAHSYPHDARLRGLFRMTVDDVDSYPADGSIVHIPAGRQHTFTLIDTSGNPGLILCYWPALAA